MKMLDVVEVEVTYDGKDDFIKDVGVIDDDEDVTVVEVTGVDKDAKGVEDTDVEKDFITDGKVAEFDVKKFSKLLTTISI